MANGIAVYHRTFIFDALAPCGATVPPRRAVFRLNTPSLLLFTLNLSLLLVYLTGAKSLMENGKSLHAK